MHLVYLMLIVFLLILSFIAKLIRGNENLVSLPQRKYIIIGTNEEETRKGSEIVRLHYSALSVTFG